MSPPATPRPFLGYGLGLRPDHYEAILDGEPYVDWFEVISENYMTSAGPWTRPATAAASVRFAKDSWRVPGTTRWRFAPPAT